MTLQDKLSRHDVGALKFMDSLSPAIKNQQRTPTDKQDTANIVMADL